MKVSISTTFVGTSMLMLVTSSYAQSSDSGSSAARSGVDLEEIVVTARRVEERLQDVPISMKVFSEQELANANIVNASDLTTVTPGLIANERFGADNSSFAIRGFTQELRTTPSVAVYFADVVAPRGGSVTTSGDGAGPGAFFDLQNVQILRGPQGTLFGRNTTGGAVLLVPQRPSYEVGGYVEGSAGDFGMRRGQAVLNLPAGDSLRFRFGVDRQKRDGYLNNVSAIGPDKFADVDYTTFRASMVIDVTPNLENYTIGTYTDSSNNGTLSQVFACNPSVPNTPRSAESQMCRGALGGDVHQGDFYDVQNAIASPKSDIKQWQAINTTTWKVIDTLTIKNVISMANITTTLANGVVGTEWRPSDITTSLFGAPLTTRPDTSANRYLPLSSSGIPGVPSVDQDTLVEELQFQGTGFESRLRWQGGLYFEKSDSGGPTAVQGGSNLLCDRSTFGTDMGQFRCADTRYILARASGLSPAQAASQSGVANRLIGTTEFENRAIYGQSTFDFTEQLSLTGGFRYTWDEATGVAQNINSFFSPVAPDGIVVGNASTADDLVAPTAVRCSDPSLTYDPSDPSTCTTHMKKDSSAPTWMVGLDYKPWEDMLIYGKYARGYRQGSVNIASVAGGYTYEPEKVDAYELGVKTSWAGIIPGKFNIAIFYNDLTDQQLQLGLLPVGGNGTTAIVNTGASTIQGLELDSMLELFKGFTLNVAYTYLDSEVKEAEHLITPGPNPAVCRSFFKTVCVLGGTTAALEGYPTAFSPKHQASATATYRLPVPKEIGDIALSATYSYTHSYFAVMPVSTLADLSNPARVNPFAEVPSFGTLNINLNWNAIAGSHVDGAVFATNALDKEYWTFVGGQYTSSGYEYRQLGRPRMIGARLRYNF